MSERHPMFTPDSPATRTPELAAKTAAKLAAVFCPKTTAKPRPNTKPKNAGARHLTPRTTANEVSPANLLAMLLRFVRR